MEAQQQPPEQKQPPHSENLRGAVNVAKTTTSSKQDAPLQAQQQAQQQAAPAKKRGAGPKKLSNATLRVPLLSHSGTHHLQIYVGQPPVLRTLIVDTGSRLTAWTCHPCPTCGNRDHYDPSISTTSSVALAADMAVSLFGGAVGKKKNFLSWEQQQATFRKCTDPVTSCHFSDVSICSRDQRKCLLEQRYTEGSTWEAYEVTDIITLGGVLPVGADSRKNTTVGNVDDYEASLPYATFPFTFGCQSSLSGLFRNQFADGIMGLEHSNYSLLEALYKSHILEEFREEEEEMLENDKNNKAMALRKQQQRHQQQEEEADDVPFSMCLSWNSGFMGLGGALIERHLQPMRVTPLVRETDQSETTKSKGMYAVMVKQVWLGPVCITCEHPEFLEEFTLGKGTILDSGTTDTYLPGQMDEVWEDVWNAQTGRSMENNTDYYSEAELEQLPTVRFVFQHNVTINVPPTHYMEPELDPKTGKQNVKDNKKQWSNRIYIDEMNGAVLGINVMMNHDILFDWHKGIVGIAPADCESEY